MNYSSKFSHSPTNILVSKDEIIKLISTNYLRIKLKWEGERKRKSLAYTVKHINITSKKEMSRATITLISVIDHKAVIALFGFCLPLSIYAVFSLLFSIISDVLFYLTESPKLSFLKSLSLQSSCLVFVAIVLH